MKKKKTVTEANVKPADEEKYADVDEVVQLTDKINELLRPYSVQVAISGLISCLVQALCITRNSKQEALEHTNNIHSFIHGAIEQADEEGICLWNTTLQ